MNQWFSGCVIVGLVLLFSGCRKEKAGEKKTQLATGGETLAVKLAAADAYDGTTDKIVSKCFTCGLRMPGSDEHAVTVEGYSVHLCSADCETRFKKDTTKAILALNIPDK